MRLPRGKELYSAIGMGVAVVLVWGSLAAVLLRVAIFGGLH
jgi:hypothetical protein